MMSSKNQNYHICEILYNIYKDNIFQNKKEIKFFSINAPSFIKDTEHFGHCLELIDAAVNPYHIATLNKQLDKAEIENVCHDIDEECLITLLEYQNIKIEKKTRHRSNYIGIGDRVQSHKDKLKKETNK